MNIELASAEDVPAILGISNWAAAHLPANFATAPEPLAMWQTLFDDTHEKYPWLVARETGQVLGWAKAGPYNKRGAYRFTAEVSVYVHPQQHRRGIGKALYEKLIPMLREQGYVTLVAGITSPNPPSEQLHASLGFVRCATFHRVGWKWDRYYDVAYYELLLREGEPPTEILPVRAVWR